jgi:glutaredoxin
MPNDPKPTPETEEEGETEEERRERLRKNYPLSRQVPSIFVNNFYVTGASSFVRIAFAESAEEPPGNQYRVTVTLPLEDAKELARVVAEMVSEIEEEEAAEKVKK